MTDVATLRQRLFLTVPEAAAILRTDPRTLRRAIEAGDITAVRVNGVVRIPTQRFLAEVCLDAPAEQDQSPASALAAPGGLALVDRAPPGPSAA